MILVKSIIEFIICSAPGVQTFDKDFLYIVFLFYSKNGYVMFYVYASNGLHPLNKSLSFTTRGDHTRWK